MFVGAVQFTVEQLEGSFHPEVLAADWTVGIRRRVHGPSLCWRSSQLRRGDRQTGRQILSSPQSMLEARCDLGKETSRQDSWTEEVVVGSGRRVLSADQTKKGYEGRSCLN